MPEYYDILGLRYKRNQDSREIGVYHAGSRKHIVYITLSTEDIKDFEKFSKRVELLLSDEPIHEKRKKKIRRNLEKILEEIQKIEGIINP